ncbi:hypothetical protein PC116_g10743 [Phytophthora cactorum]|nr:hypothetical protein PC116_g10743 [Phytophthora cactorum]
MDVGLGTRYFGVWGVRVWSARCKECQVQCCQHVLVGKAWRSGISRHATHSVLRLGGVLSRGCCVKPLSSLRCGLLPSYLIQNPCRSLY